MPVVMCICAAFRNSFSQLVGEEFLKFFDFTGDTLDEALRWFVRHLTPTGEPQDRDQLLSHFAQRYHSCNSSQYKSAGNVTTGLLFVLSIYNRRTVALTAGRGLDGRMVVRGMHRQSGELRLGRGRGLSYEARGYKQGWVDGRAGKTGKATAQIEPKSHIAKIALSVILAHY